MPKPSLGEWGRTATFAQGGAIGASGWPFYVDASEGERQQRAARYPGPCGSGGVTSAGVVKRRQCTGYSRYRSW
jgi:hypothetical protein